MSGRKPWIGIPSRYNSKRTGCAQDRRYLDAIEAAGGTPLLIPVFTGDEVRAEYAGRMDGLLLPGSPTDIDPAIYRAAAHPRLGRLLPERDRLDFALLAAAAERGLPVFGICYGVQSMNVFRGGTLVQDIPSEVAGAMEHNTPGDPEESMAHAVRLEAGSRLQRTIRATEIEVNSFHHQAVDRPGRGLAIVARSADGVAEAIEDPESDFFLGVQWHPETGWDRNPVARALFGEFTAAAGRRAMA